MKRGILLSFFLLSAINANAATQKQMAINEENRNFLELKEKEKEIQAITGVKYDVTKNLNEIKNVQIYYNTKDISISSSSIIKLDFHHAHFTKIYFPVGAVVVESKTSQEFKDNDIFSNRVELRPKPDLIQASVSISFIYKKKTYDVTIIANKYDVSNPRNNTDNVLYPKINLIIDNPLEPKEIIKKYRADYGKLPTNEFTAYKVGDKFYTIEYGDFNDDNPFNKPNLFVLFNQQIHKYKIALGD